MRNVFTILIIISCFTVSMMAQGKLKQATIITEIVSAESSDKEMNDQIGMMNGTETELIFNEAYSLVKMNMMNGMVKSNSLTDLATGDTRVYTDAMGMKYLITMSKEELEKMAEEHTGDITAEYDKSDTKEILGYPCYKMLMNDKKTKTKTTCYITEEISINMDMVKGFKGTDFVGFPLEYTIEEKGSTFTFRVTDISKSIDSSEFEIDETGYEKMSMDALGKLGGMGF